MHTKTLKHTHIHIYIIIDCLCVADAICSILFIDQSIYPAGAAILFGIFLATDENSDKRKAEVSMSKETRKTITPGCLVRILH